MQNLFIDLFLKVKGPRDAAMFASTVTEEGEDVYFSPGAIALIESIIDQHPGEETERPNVRKLALLVGHDEVWDTLLKNND
jgi:hypothetical protein